MTEANNLMHVISSDAMLQTAPGSAIACVVGHPATENVYSAMDGTLLRGTCALQ